MKFLFKVLLPLLGLAIALPFVLKDGEGRPLLSFGDYQPPKIHVPQMPDVAGALDRLTESDPKEPAPDQQSVAMPVPVPAPTASAGSGKIYKWRDAQGKLHFSDKPNPAGSSDEVAIAPNTNVLEPPRPSAPPPPPPQGQVGTPAPVESKGLELPSITTVPLEDIPQLIEDAQGLTEMADQHQAALKEALGR